MPLTAGTRLGHYDVTALLGEGGMGQVWQATDTQLNRQVALKILPDAFASDPDRLARFTREAQILASLNHPNIAAIYGIEEAEGTRALVLELVEGPTLADRISKGPIPLDEALPIAKQIAEALEAAHEAGVIHRDLKPANIKVREDGTVKVLDFGLAKALDPNPEGDPSQSPTLTAAATQMGVILGTAAYMSPEQAAGQTSDKRSDAWSFGVVLYEMLTGQRLFTGETVSHVLAKVLDRELDLSALTTSTPPPIRRLLRRCLERKPKRRLSDLGEALSHLEEARAPVDEAPSAVPSVPPVAQPSGWRQALPWAGGIALAVATGLTVWGLTRPAPPAPRSPVRFSVSLPASDRLFVDNLLAGMALSDDGETLVYAATRDGVRQLYRRPLGQLEAISIAGTEGSTNPFLSPDGAWIGFEVGGALKRMAVTGGPAATLYEGALAATDASWGTNDVIVFGLSSDGNPLMQAAATGGVAEAVTTLADGENDHRQPALLPGGTALLFTVASGTATNIAVKSLETGERRDLFDGSSPRYAASGHIVFAAISEFPKGRKYLISLSFRGKASVRPAQVGGFDVNIVIHGSTAVRGRGDLVAYRWALWKLTAPWTHRTRPPHLGKRCAFSTSSTGPFPSNHSRKTPKGPKIALGNPDRPVFARENALWAVPFDADTLSVTGDAVPVLEGVAIGTTGYAHITVAGNGSLAYVPGVAGTGQGRTLVWVDRDGREEELLAPPAPYETPRVSPDGRYVAVEVRDPENADVMVYDLQRETPTRLTFDPGADRNPLWSSDGQRVLFSSNRDGSSANIYAKAADGTGPVERVTTSDTVQSPSSWSADGQLLVIQDFGDSFDLRLVSLGGENRTEGLIETEGVDIHGKVSPDGRWMAYMSNESGQFEVYVRPFPNVDDGRWQISRDGGRSPLWAPDGQELFFKVGSDVMAVTVETEPTFNPGNPEVLFTGQYRSSSAGRGPAWDVAPDGRFLMIRSAGATGQAAAPHIVVVENWFEELQRLVPIN